MRFLDLGMVLMPIIFLFSSVMFYDLNANMYAASCFVLAIIFSVVLISEFLKAE